MHFSILILLFTISPMQTTVDSQFSVSKGRVGSVHIGMTIPELLKLYDSTHIEFGELNSEGNSTPAVKVTYGEQKESFLTLLYEGENDRGIVLRITLYNKRFRTSKGISVGSTLGELRRSYTIRSIEFGMTDLYASVPELSMVFELESSSMGRDAGRLVRLKQVPDNITITSIILN